eukprot:CAMPEP_0184710592 /NCGR_PEP_ID=MMETSP0314-20130426/1350_1 /TAXON_ID=38298 /ORGANISM="Rhodella maculata, Strain CCMP 736" /LENGTH=845 /DNA_ID=CAMNT_0027172459 /DNA_START=65 /DNA_END=2602 /DNA_ORIENTATION=-
MPVEVAVVFTKDASQSFVSAFVEFYSSTGLAVRQLPACPAHYPSTKTSTRGAVALVNASEKVLVATAEKLHVRKMTKEGFPALVRPANMGKFEIEGEEGVLSQADQLTCIEYILMWSIPKEKEAFEGIEEYSSLMKWGIENDYIETFFPLSDEKATTAIAEQITYSTPFGTDKTLRNIREYFGDKVALYFAFVKSYTQAGLVLAACGFFVFLGSLFGDRAAAVFLSFFVLFIAVWSGLTYGQWIIRRSMLVYRWSGFLAFDPMEHKIVNSVFKEDYRDDYKGFPTSDPVTKKESVLAKPTDQLARMAISWLVVLVYVVLSMYLLYLALQLENVLGDLVDYYATEFPILEIGLVATILKMMWMAVYIPLLNILNAAFRPLAMALTKFENHKTKSSYEDHLLSKLIIFFYISVNANYYHGAFVRREPARVSKLLRNAVIIDVIKGNIAKLMPLIQKFVSDNFSKGKKKGSDDWKKHVDPAMKRVLDELDRPGGSSEEQMFMDYFEILRQYILMISFAVAFPLGAVFVMLSSAMEFSGDVLKWCSVERRQFPRRAISIGQWSTAFNLLSYLAIGTNVFFFSYAYNYAQFVQGYENDTLGEMILVFFAEHALVMIRILVVSLSSQIPKSLLLADRTVRGTGKMVDGIVIDEITVFRGETINMSENTDVDPRDVMIGKASRAITDGVTFVVDKVSKEMTKQKEIAALKKANKEKDTKATEKPSNGGTPTTEMARPRSAKQVISGWASTGVKGEKTKSAAMNALEETADEIIEDETDALDSVQDKMEDKPESEKAEESEESEGSEEPEVSEESEEDEEKSEESEEECEEEETPDEETAASAAFGRARSKFE